MVEIKATANAGYMPPEAGPFACRHCTHYKNTPTGSGCDDREVVRDLGQGKSGLAPVSPDGCCNEFKPIERRSSIGMTLLALCKK